MEKLTLVIIDKINNSFDSVWSNHLGKAQYTVAMEQALQNVKTLIKTFIANMDEFSEKVLRGRGGHVKSEQNQIKNYASFYAHNLALFDISIWNIDCRYLRKQKMSWNTRKQKVSRNRKKKSV